MNRIQGKKSLFFLILLIACETKPRYQIVSNDDTTSVIFQNPYKKYSFIDKKKARYEIRTTLYVEDTLNRKLYLYVYHPIFFQSDVLRNAQMILLNIENSSIVKKLYMPCSSRDTEQEMELYKNNIIVASLDQMYVVRKDLGKMYNVGHYIQNILHKDGSGHLYYYLKGDSIYLKKVDHYEEQYFNFKEWLPNKTDYIACPLY
jgi:hypothetical protein